MHVLQVLVVASVLSYSIVWGIYTICFRIETLYIMAQRKTALSANGRPAGFDPANPGSSPGGASTKEAK